jgi:hypothetical protein
MDFAIEFDEVEISRYNIWRDSSSLAILVMLPRKLPAFGNRIVTAYIIILPLVEFSGFLGYKVCDCSVLASKPN